MTRPRSPASDFNAPNLNAEEYHIKIALYQVSGMYLNFAYNTFIKHNELDKAKIRAHVNGFSHNVANGIAKEALVKYLGQYLEPNDFATLRLVCKPQT
jgi:hypothetical protein